MSRSKVIAAIAAGVLLYPSTARAVDEPSFTWAPASPSNFRAASRTPDMIVIHKSEGSAASAISWFKNPAARVSAHWLVAHSGQIYHMVDDTDVAWHATVANARAIGIENEGWTYRNDIGETHYHALAHLVAWECQRWHIPADRHHIIGHVEVPGSTHTDPGPYFDWNKFMSYVRAYLGNAPPTPAPLAPPAPKPTPGATPPPTSPGGGAARIVAVDAERLNVRAGPWGNVLGVVSNGAKFVRTGNESQGFVEVYFGGKRAWLAANYLKPATGRAVVIDTAALNVRSTPRIEDGNVVSVAHQGEIYVEEGGNTHWRFIQFDGRQEYVATGYTHEVSVGP